METSEGSKDSKAKSDGDSRFSTTRGERQQRKSEIVSKFQICVNETELCGFLSKIGDQTIYIRYSQAGRHR